MEPSTANNFLSQELFGNSYARYLMTLGIIVVGSLLVWIIKKIALVRLQKWAERTENTIDDFVILIFKKIGVPLMYLTVAFFSMNNLNWGEKIKEFLDKAAILIATVYVIKAVTMLVNYIVVDILAKKEADETRLKSIKGLMVLIKVIIWVIGIIMLLDNMGYKVSTVVTGLGIGGIAVALAAQAVLGDLFSYISIIFDRPFQLGDVIVSGDVTGTVENIGIKTTRIRSVWGEEIILSNSQLTGSKIQNLKRMENRRVLFALGVTYDTPVEVLKGIPESIKEIIDGVKETKFDRAHFRSFGDFSLNFEVVYTVLNPDYTRYMDIQQEINFKIAEKFATQKIEFAYPTQTLQIKK